ncbi:hypothetical protein [Sinomicrobium sp.]
MDEFELLKKDWKKRETSLPKLSYEDIYAMILKKSSSNVKWIFIISFAEMLIGLPLLFYTPDETEHLNYLFIDILTYASYPICIYFVYRFYKNYKKISATSSVRGLIDSIIRARKTVKHYIIFNLSIMFVISVYASVATYIEESGGWTAYKQLSAPTDHLVLIALTILATLLIIGLAIGFYLLLYGFLLRRLHKNYKELKKIEV